MTGSISLVLVRTQDDRLSLCIGVPGSITCKVVELGKMAELFGKTHDNTITQLVDEEDVARIVREARQI